MAWPAQLLFDRRHWIVDRRERAVTGDCMHRDCMHGDQTGPRPATFWQALGRHLADPQTGAGLH
ncbi:hypothetical protein CVO74_14975 [Xanthomonas prunicola]|uniref:Uncharacterized protein n=1 Tax=Xanthomonas prunicola TaxID=2053930 RepID=A0A2N3RIP8_9XANT|nr:hypothetical protein XpruCFBP8353_10540 [Xanthomonas prunicola]PKV16647.1 hypothetical protein XpruCFBP8354_10540 [Xanthomonas prunicola]PKV20937.1 hypothetical protein CVO74_14975 [Xanthomonas prunicola]